MTHPMIKAALIVAIGLAGAVLCAVFVPRPGFAAEPAGICYTEPQLEQDAKAKGRKIVGGASYDGAETDSLVVVQTATDILIYGFRDGCYIGLTQLEQVANPKPAKGA